MPDVFVVVVGLAGAAIFYWLPRSRWHRMRLEQLYGDEAPAILRRRVIGYTILAVLFLIIGLINL